MNPTKLTGPKALFDRAKSTFAGAFVTLVVLCPASTAGQAINPVTNQIYVVNETLPYVNVIDGATHELKSVDIGCIPSAIETNPVTNKIYVACLLPSHGKGKANPPNRGALTVIDGVTNQLTKIALPFT